MEGLPVRQWKQQSAVISTAPPQDTKAELAKMGRWVELDMPKGSDMYSPWCHALLRAARRGQIKTPHSRTVEEEKEMQDDEEADNPAEESYVAPKWSQLPKDVDQPEPDFLAKRRKGLRSLYGSGAPASGPMRKTKVKKVDAEGNVSIYEVLAPEGARVEGEILEDTELPAEVAVPGTVVEGVGVVNAEGVVVATEPAAPTPPRRRPPPPKRKPKGPGRGRKKKVVIESAGRPTGVPVESNTTLPPGGPSDTDIQMSSDMPILEVANESKTKEASAGNEGDEGSEEEDDEGEEAEDPDREEGEIAEVNTADSSPSKPPPTSIPPLSSMSLAPPRSEEPINRDASSSPDVPLAALPTPLKTQQSLSDASLPPSDAEAPVTRPSMESRATSDASVKPSAEAANIETEPSLAVPADMIADAVIPAADAAHNESGKQDLEAPADPAFLQPKLDPPAEVPIAKQPEGLSPKDEPAFTTLSPSSARPGSPGHSIFPESSGATASQELPVADAVLVNAPVSTLLHSESETSPVHPEPAPPAEPTAAVSPQAPPLDATSDDKLEAADPITVAEAQPVEPKVEVVSAHIPADHNQLAGLAAPREEQGSEKIEGAEKDVEAFPDGEEDLFGSLERHLNEGQQESK